MRYAILGSLCLLAMIAYVQRAAISVPAEQIGADFQLQEATKQLGRLQSAWYLGYAIFQLPSGWLADRFGSRTILPFLAALWSVFLALAGLMPNFPGLVVMWFLMGSAQAGIFPCATKSMRAWFPEGERARASGLLACGMTLGGALAPVLTSSLLLVFREHSYITGFYPWQVCLLFYAVPGILWALFFFFATPEAPQPKTAVSTQQNQSLPWGKLFTSLPLWLLCGQQFFRAAGMIFFLTWFPTFLQKTRDVSIERSGLLTTVAGLGAMAGSLLGGFVSDALLQATQNRRLSRQGIAVVGMSCCAVLIVCSYFVADTTLAITLIALGAFCATFGGVSGYTVAMEFGGKHVALVFSTMNMCGNIGAMLFPITVGWLVVKTDNWNVALFLFAGIMAVDAICWALLNPHGTLAGEANARG